jgi:menaquinone-dependent protoporphyrinogen IX oxidase
MAKVLDAEIRSPQETNPEELEQYGILGFGSGIYAGKHHELLLDFTNRLPKVSNGGRAFIFSTSGETRHADKFHSKLRENRNLRVT